MVFHNDVDMVRNENAAQNNQLQQDLEECINYLPSFWPFINDGHRDGNRFITMTTRLDTEREALMLSPKTFTMTNAGRIDNHDGL